MTSFIIAVRGQGGEREHQTIEPTEGPTSVESPDWTIGAGEENESAEDEGSELYADECFCGFGVVRANRGSCLHQSNFARVPSSRPRLCPPGRHPSRHVEAPRPLRSVSACAKCQLATPLSRSGQAPPRPSAVQGAAHFHPTTNTRHFFTHLRGVSCLTLRVWSRKKRGCS